MNEISTELAKLPATHITRLLETLHQAKFDLDQNPDETLPVATFILTSGTEVIGRLEDLKRDTDGSTCLISIIDPNRKDGSRDFAYISASAICAIVLLEAARVAYFFSEGKIEHPLGIAPPNQLEIRRRLEQFKKETFISIQCDFDFKEEGLNNWNIAMFLGRLNQSLISIKSTAIGTQALSDACGEIELTSGPFTVSRVDKRLRIQLPLDSNSSEWPSRAQLKELIQKQL